MKYVTFKLYIGFAVDKSFKLFNTSFKLAYIVKKPSLNFLTLKQTTYFGVRCKKNGTETKAKRNMIY